MMAPQLMEDLPVHTNRQSISLPSAIGLFAAIAVLVGGVTFAALRSQNNLVTGSRMTSASADLSIAKVNNNQYSTSMAGYDFFDLVPGGNAMPQNGNDLYFRNSGSTNLDLRISMNPSRLVNPNAVALQKARIVITDDAGTIFAQPSLAQLMDAYAVNETIPLNLVIGRGIVEHMKIKMKLDDGAFGTTSQATIENIDLIFSGIAQNT